MTFSPKFKSFAQWRKHAKKTAYAKRITELHTLYPRATLKQLRTRTLTYNKSWSSLSARERSTRKLALETLRRIRQGNSLTRAAKQVGITPTAAKRHLGRALIRKGKRWVARNHNTIERSIRIYSNGRSESIIIDSPKSAKIIAKHFNAVQKYLNSGNQHVLKPFRGVRIKDVEGNLHELETDPKTLRDIDERMEDREFFEVYDE